MNLVRFFQAPPGDDHRARLLHYVSNIVLIPVCAHFLANLISGSGPGLHLFLQAVMIGSCLVARAAMHAGRVRLGASLVVGFLTMATLGVIFQDGWTAPSSISAFVAVATAAVLLGASSGLVTTGVVLGALLLAGLAESRGWIRPSADIGALQVAVGWLGVLGSVGVLVSGATRMLERSIVEARKSRERLAELIASAPDGIVVVDRDSRVLAANPAVEKITGYGAEVLGMTIEQAPFLDDANRRLARSRFDQFVRGEEGTLHEYDIVRKDGSRGRVEINRRILGEGAATRVQVVIRDVTQRAEEEAARRDLEAQLRHAQRMESVGRLAGGVAHEFNNSLTVILGSTELLQGRSDLPEEASLRLGDIRRAADRAGEITRKLLAFSHSEPAEAEFISVNRLIDDVRPMLAQVVGESVALEIDAHAPADVIRADPTLIEQVIVNLVANARDAMDGSGRLVVSTRTVDSEAVPGAGGEPSGRELELRVEDDGPGIAEGILDRIFEPFFTTKKAGKGTGLGLSMVHGIVKQSGGRIAVRNAPGGGAEFRICWPVADESCLDVGTNEAPTRATEGESTGTRESILVVDDDPAIARLTSEMLETAGYRVLVAHDSAEAEQRARECAGGLDLLISDVVLVGESGPEIAERVLAASPRAKILFMSGHAGDALSRHGLQEDARVLSKPFVRDVLLESVRSTLRRTTESRSGSPG